MSGNVIYLDRRRLMPKEPSMNLDIEIDERATELAVLFAESIPKGVGLDVAGVAGAQFLAIVAAFESDGDTDKALKTVFYLSQLIGTLTIRECIEMVDRKSGEKSQ